MTQSRRFLGITVLSPFFQNEGIDAVLDNLIERAGATAVAVNTSVTAPCEAGTGSFQPPSDAETSPRLFDRPIWGKQAGWLRSGPGHVADPVLYRDSPYPPREPNDLTGSDGPIIGEFIRAAKARGLKVYIQTGATQPPDLRDEDLPRLPDGRIPQGRMAHVGSLASPAIRAYNRAWVADIFRQYPQIDGIRPDWPEYPCYTLDEAFQDFGLPVEQWAEANGYDFKQIRQDVGRLYDYLHGELADGDLIDWAGPDRGKFSLAQLLNHFPGVADWFRLKAALSTDLLRDYREAIQRHGGPEKELAANAFMPPFTQFTGLDLAGAAAHCQSIAPKLYTMHWSLIIKFWGDVLLGANPGLDEELLVRALVNLLDLVDDKGGRTIADYGYPGPDDPHPIADGPQIRKIEQALAAVRGRTRINALVHAYGPPQDFRRRFALAANSRADGIWVNRYGYLSDEKLDMIGALSRDER